MVFGGSYSEYHFFLSLDVRRFHDLGYSGWLVLLTAIPIINIFYRLLLFVYPGKNYTNRYGGKPSSKLHQIWNPK